MQITLKNYKKLLSKIQKTIKQTEGNIVKSVNRQKVEMSWKIGKEIDQHLKDSNRADYGEEIFKRLVRDTSIKKTVLYQMRAFYKSYPRLPSEKKALSWSHYRNLITVKDQEARGLLENFVVKNNLGTNKLQHVITEEKNQPRKSKRQKISDKSAKLKVTRGRLFTYEIVNLSDSKKTFVDLGFNMFCEIKTTLKDGEIVESKKSGEKILLKKSNVKPVQMHTYKAYLERVVDGDTIHVILDLGFKMQHREILRLAKINAAESGTGQGIKATEALKEILKDVPFLVVKTNKTDIYGRYIADVFFDKSAKETDLQKIADGGVYLSQLLLDQGLVEVF